MHNRYTVFSVAYKFKRIGYGLFTVNLIFLCICRYLEPKFVQLPIFGSILFAGMSLGLLLAGFSRSKSEYVIRVKIRYFSLSISFIYTIVHGSVYPIIGNAFGLESASLNSHELILVSLIIYHISLAYLAKILYR